MPVNLKSALRSAKHLAVKSNYLKKELFEIFIESKRPNEQLRFKNTNYAGGGKADKKQQQKETQT